MENLSSRSHYFFNIIKAFDFSTLYKKTIIHAQLNSTLKELIQSCFSHKHGYQRYQFPVIGRDKSCFFKSH